MPPTNPLVSIVIPSFNPGRMLEDCLRSCFAQTYPAIEIIVVDNNSTDGSVERAERLSESAPHRMTVTHCAEQGVNRARNFGLSVARGGYVQWLDSDDALHPDKLALQVEALEREVDYDIAYGDWTWQFHEPDGTARRQHVRETMTDDFLWRLLCDDWLPPHAYLLKRAAAERLNAARAFDPATTVATDREYFSTAALTGERFLYVPGADCVYNRWSDSQTTASRSHAERAQSLERIFRRLTAKAEAGGVLGLGDRHWELLRQDRGLWAARRESLSIRRKDDGRFEVLDRASGQVLALSGETAQLLAIVGKMPSAGTLEQIARAVRRIDPRRNDYYKLFKAVDSLREHGLLRRVVAPDAEMDAR